MSTALPPNATMGAVNERLELLNSGIDRVWVALSAILVFYMQTGFALLEAGNAPTKNTQNVLMKNILDASFGLVVFWAVGFAFAFGDSDTTGALIGLSNFFLAEPTSLTFVFFQFAFAINAATIFGGSIQGRTRFAAFVVVSSAITGIIFPVPAHWVWSEKGWLHNMGEYGMIDYAGSGVVHLVGGLVGLVGAIIVGPRVNRFPAQGGIPTHYRPHSLPLCTLGMLILWTGWFGFNAGSGRSMVGRPGDAAGRALWNTAVAPAAASVTMFAISRFWLRRYSLMLIINGVLSGLVGITASCAVVDPWAAVVVGMVAALTYTASSRVLTRLHIDDPLDAAAVHAAGGLWGLLTPGLFATRKGVEESFSLTAVTQYGVLLGGGWELLGLQIIGALCITAWTIVASCIVFAILHKANALRVDPDTEMAGLDTLKHGSQAYAEFQLTHA